MTGGQSLQKTTYSKARESKSKNAVRGTLRGTGRDFIRGGGSLENRSSEMEKGGKKSKKIKKRSL